MGRDDMDRQTQEQGCHIFLRTTYQSVEKYTKWPQNIPNSHKMSQMTTKYPKWLQNIPNGHKISQIATKYPKWPHNIPRFSISWPSTIYSNMFFGMNIYVPSGNPAQEPIGLINGE
jgi:hypothetical protein